MEYVNRVKITFKIFLNHVKLFAARLTNKRSRNHWPTETSYLIHELIEYFFLQCL